MKYSRILLAVASEVWAMCPYKLEAIMDFLRMQAEGVKFSAEEIEARITKENERAIARADGAVALLPVRGVISNRMGMLSDISGGTSIDGLARAFKAAQADAAVKAIVLDVDSPGGTVAGVDELSQMIFDARGNKPIIAHVNAQAASAAYWLASAADEIVVTSSGEVGSIGVFTVHDDVTGALDKLGVKKTLIAAGEHKGEGLPFLPLTQEARDHVQGRVESFYGMFVKAVARGRNVSQQTVRDNYGKGRMVGAEQAVALGMADKVATLDETLARFGASLYPAAPAAAKRRAFAPRRERAALSL